MAFHKKHGVTMDVTPDVWFGGSKIRLGGAVHEELTFYAKTGDYAKKVILMEAKAYHEYPEIKKGLEALAEIFN